MCSFDRKRIRRGLVNTRYKIIAMAADPPVVIPLCISAPHTDPMSDSENNPNWKDAPIQKQTPATTIFCRFYSVWITACAPSTNRYPLRTMRYPAITGPGMALSSPDNLGRKATAMKIAPMRYPNPEGGDAGGPGIRSGTRIDYVRHCSGNAGHEIGHAGAGQRPLYLPKVDSPVVALSGPLLGNGFSVCLNRDYYAKEQKHGEQGPERYAEVKPQPGELVGHPDPGGLDGPPDIVEAEDRSNRAAHDDTDYRPPESQYRRAAKNERGDDPQCGQRGQVWPHRPGLRCFRKQARHH